MKMNTAARLRFASMIIGVGMALGLPTPVITQSGYEAINLTSDANGGSAALAVNNSGQAVGWQAPAVLARVEGVLMDADGRYCCAQPGRISGSETTRRLR